MIELHSGRTWIESGTVRKIDSLTDGKSAILCWAVEVRHGEKTCLYVLDEGLVWSARSFAGAIASSLASSFATLHTRRSCR